MPNVRRRWKNVGFLSSKFCQFFKKFRKSNGFLRCLTVFNGFQFLHNKNSPPQAKNLEMSLQSFNITIIPWNSYWIWPDFGLDIENFGFIQHNCSCKNCYVSLEKSDVDKADIILLHGHEMSSVSVSSYENLKMKRQNNHGWPMILYFNKESPT